MMKINLQIKVIYNYENKRKMWKYEKIFSFKD